MNPQRKLNKLQRKKIQIRIVKTDKLKSTSNREMYHQADSLIAEHVNNLGLNPFGK